MPICGCDCGKGAKQIVLWEFYVDNENEHFFHLHKDTEVHVYVLPKFKLQKKREAGDCSWAVTAKRKGEKGLVNPTYLVPKREYDKKSVVYQSKWYVGDVNPVEALMKMSNEARVGAFLILGPGEYKLLAENLLEYLLLVRVEEELKGSDDEWLKEMLDTAPPVLAFRIRRYQNGEYMVKEDRHLKNLYSLVDDLIRNGIPEHGKRKPLKLTEPSSCLGPEYFQQVPPPPPDPTVSQEIAIDPWESDQEKPKRIERDRLRMGAKLGHGSFGVVYKGKWIKEDNSEVNVAVKSLKKDEVEMQCDLDEEIKLMGRLQNKYLVRLYGLCKEAGKKMLMVMELMDKGCLNICLQKRFDQNKKLPLRGLLEVLYQVACGMAYMEQERVVHRDLAARNVLVSTMSDWTGTVKISDFGMSRLLADNEYYKSSQQSLPWRWMALESIQTKKFTSKSDVWSYGILVFEVMTHGGRPYGELSNKEVIHMVEIGERLEQHEDIPDFLWDNLCWKCWLEEPDSRPTFADIVRFFNDLLFDNIQTSLL